MWEEFRPPLPSFCPSSCDPGDWLWLWSNCSESVVQTATGELFHTLMVPEISVLQDNCIWVVFTETSQTNFFALVGLQQLRSPTARFCKFMLATRGIFRKCSPQLSAGVPETQNGRSKCACSLSITAHYQSPELGGSWFKPISWAEDKRDWGMGTYSVSWIYGAVISKNHLAVNWEILSLLEISMACICHTAIPLFGSLLFPNNNPHLLNRVRRAGRGLRYVRPKPFLPWLLWHVTYATILRYCW